MTNAEQEYLEITNSKEYIAKYHEDILSELSIPRRNDTCGTSKGIKYITLDEADKLQQEIIDLKNKLEDVESNLCSANSIISEYIDSDIKQKKIIDKIVKKIDCEKCPANSTSDCGTVNCDKVIIKHFTKQVENEEIGE